MKIQKKVWYYLMQIQIAWTPWQMFQRGFLLRLEAGCRKMTQALWCEEIWTYIRHLGCFLLVPRYKLMCRKPGFLVCLASRSSRRRGAAKYGIISSLSEERNHGRQEMAQETG